MTEGRGRRRPSTPADRRAVRAAVEDMTIVLDAATRLLEARPRSVAETRRRLTQAGYRPDLVHAAVSRLLELGYLDDEAFARAWVESRDRAHPRGERALRHELARAGIERSLVDAVLAERASGGAGSARDAGLSGADETAAERLLERRLARLQREPDPRRRRQRAYGLLARGGFDPEVCAAVVRRLLADPPEGDAAADDPPG